MNTIICVFFGEAMQRYIPSMMKPLKLPHVLKEKKEKITADSQAEY